MNYISMVVHADWSINPKKRVLSSAHLQKNGRYRIFAPELVGDLCTLLRRVKEKTNNNGCALVGFDFPIGLPMRYAELAGIEDFLDWLPEFGKGDWREFYNVAKEPGEISLRRPFYPNKPGSSRREYLIKAIGVNYFDELRRSCEVRTPTRHAASPLFWTLGPQQVGKAAINGWRDLLAPGLDSQNIQLSIWPFSGNLEYLIDSSDIVVVETYPAEFYSHFDFRFDRNVYGGKRSMTARASCALALKKWANEYHVEIDRTLEIELDEGFTSKAFNDDGFDACVGVFGMLNVILGGQFPLLPRDPEIKKVEGWIFGQSLSH